MNTACSTNRFGSNQYASDKNEQQTETKMDITRFVYFPGSKQYVMWIQKRKQKTIMKTVQSVNLMP